MKLKPQFGVFKSVVTFSVKHCDLKLVLMIHIFYFIQIILADLFLYLLDL